MCLTDVPCQLPGERTGHGHRLAQMNLVVHCVLHCDLGDLWRQYWVTMTDVSWLLSAHLHRTVLRNVLRDVKTRDGGVIHGHLHGGVPGILENDNH